VCESRPDVTKGDLENVSRHAHLLHRDVAQDDEHQDDEAGEDDPGGHIMSSTQIGVWALIILVIVYARWTLLAIRNVREYFADRKAFYRRQRREAREKRWG
jgi:hypothetical protein